MADPNYAAGFSALGGAVSSLFGAAGAAESASSYSDAAAIADQNAKIAAQSAAIKQTQLARQIYQTVSTQKAGVAGAGFAASGSALDLLRSSASQGALAKAQATEQGIITANSYAQQAGMYRGLAGAANTSSTGQEVGGILGLVGAAASIFSLF